MDDELMTSLLRSVLESKDDLEAGQLLELPDALHRDLAAPPQVEGG